MRSYAVIDRARLPLPLRGKRVTGYDIVDLSKNVALSGLQGRPQPGTVCKRYSLEDEAFLQAVLYRTDDLKAAQAERQRLTQEKYRSQAQTRDRRRQAKAEAVNFHKCIMPLPRKQLLDGKTPLHWGFSLREELGKGCPVVLFVNGGRAPANVWALVKAPPLPFTEAEIEAWYYARNLLKALPLYTRAEITQAQAVVAEAFTRMRNYLATFPAIG